MYGGNNFQQDGGFGGGMPQGQFGDMGGNNYGMEGGFMSSPQAGSQSPNKRGEVRQTLTPVTIRQLLTASQLSPDDTQFQIDNKDVAQVTFVANIVSINAQSTNLTFVVDDGTGSIEVRQWINEDEGLYQNEIRNSLSEGKYVRVFGHLKSFMSKRNILAFSSGVRPVVDPNEITFHMLEVIYIHKVNTKGPLANPADQKPAVAQNYGAVPQGGAPMGNQMNAPQNQWNQQSLGYGQQQQQDANSLSPLQSAIIDVVKRLGSESEGMYIFDLVANLKSMAPEQQIRRDVDFLSGEGHLYSTIDEEHFKTTD